MRDQYAICAKVDGIVKYLNRFPTKEYNNSSLESAINVYEFGDLGDNTLMAYAEDWKNFLSPKRFKEIAEYMVGFNFTNFRMAFVKVAKIERYETAICNPFILNGVESPDGELEFTTYGLNLDCFC